MGRRLQLFSVDRQADVGCAPGRLTRRNAPARRTSPASLHHQQVPSASAATATSGQVAVFLPLKVLS
jgi:hypothetical protein